MKALNEFLNESTKYKSIVAYHGSNKKISKIDTNANQSGSDFGSGAYFTTNINTAKEYGRHIYKAEITFKDPLVLEDRYRMNDIWDYLVGDKEEGTVSKDTSMKEYIMSKGADGIVVNNPIMGQETDEIWYIVYKPNQVKNLEQVQ